MTIARRIASFLGWCLIAGVLQQGNPVFAKQQEAYSPVVPDPSECVVQPRSPDTLLNLVESASPSQSMEDYVDSLMIAEEYQEVDPAVVSAITDTVREITACINANDKLRQYSLYTDDLVRRGVYVEANDIDSVGEPLPVAERTALIGLAYFHLLADQRIGAVVVIDDPKVPAPAEPFFGVFTKESERWLLDDIADPYGIEVDVRAID